MAKIGKRRAAAADEGKAPIPDAMKAKMLRSVAAPMLLAQAIAMALDKGYQVVLVPGGDPVLWRDLAERSLGAITFAANSPLVTPEQRAAFQAWLAEFTIAVQASAIQLPTAQAQPEGAE